MDRRKPMIAKGLSIGSAPHPLKRYCERRRHTGSRRERIRRAFVRLTREIAAASKARDNEWN